MTEDVREDAADAAAAEEGDLTLKQVTRRYQRRVVTIQRADMGPWKHNGEKAREWKDTLEGPHEAGAWLMKVMSALMIDTARKTEGGSGPSSHCIGLQI